VTFQGRRREDTPLDRLPEDLQHGDYWRVLSTNGEHMTSESPTNLTGQVWMCWLLIRGMGGEFHGYLEHVWSTV
jgi:uncharacterized protein YqcC (DUF446 family)